MMTLNWTQGAKGFQFGFVQNNVLCIRSGPTIRFIDFQTNETQYFRSTTNHVTKLSVHPLEPYVAITETRSVNPKVFIYKYPELKEIVLKGSGKLEIRQTVFSNSNYLAVVSGVPDFLLSLWNFETATLMCQCQLNGSQLTTLSFCPIDWRLLVGTDDRCLHIWQVEICERITLIRCRSKNLPNQAAPLGICDGDTPVSCCGSKTTQEPTRFDPKLPQSAISGVTDDKQLEFADYMDQTEHVLCVSQTWTNNELVFLGCKYGELLLVDPISGSIKVLLNPLSFQAYSKDSFLSGLEDRTCAPGTLYSQVSSVKTGEASFPPPPVDYDLLKVPFGCFTKLIYTKQGLLCAGKDGVLRLITLSLTKALNQTAIKESDFTSDHLAPNINAMLLRVQVNACHKLFTFQNPFKSNDSPCTLHITGMSISPSYGRLAISSQTGQLAILNLMNDKFTIDRSLSADFQYLTTGDSFVGLGLLGPEKNKYCVTARKNGVVNTWDLNSGELIGSLVIGEQCHSIAVSPLIALVVVGLQSGVVLFFDCRNPKEMRIVRSLKLFKNPASHMCFEPTGELLVAVADDEETIVISGHASRKFEPLGFVSITGKVINLDVLKLHDQEKTFVLVTTGENQEVGATDVYIFELVPSILYNASHAYADSCRGLQENAIRLMHLQFNSPTIASCLWPSWSTNPAAPPILFAADTNARYLHTFVLPDEPVHKPPPQSIINRNHTVTAGRQQGTSFKFTSGSQSSIGALSTNIITALNADPSSNQQMGQPPTRRNSRRTRTATGLMTRLTSTNTGAPNVPEPIESATEEAAQIQQRSSYLNPLGSCRILRGIRKLHLTKLYGHNLMKVCYGDGKFELIEITRDEMYVKFSLAIHEFDNIGITGVECCGNINSLISCGHDGLLSRISITQNSSKDSLPVDTHLPELLELANQQSRRLALLPTHQPQESASELPNAQEQTGEMGHNSSKPLFFRTSTVMSVVDHSLELSDDNNSTDRPLELGPVLSEPHRPTWTEECELEAQSLENQVYMDAQEKLRNDLVEIRKLINAMAEENEQLPSIQRIGRQEFELDVDEQASIIEETEQAVKQVREDIELSDLAKQFIWKVIKKRCWDEMQIKGRRLMAFNAKLEVCNFPLSPRTSMEMARLSAVRTRRKIQLLLGEEIERMNLCAQQPDEIRAIQHEEADEDEEHITDVNRVMEGSIAMDYGGTNEYMYGQMELYTREEKIYQIVLIKDNIYRIKESFNKQFDDAYEKKRSGLERIRSRLARIRKILVDLQQPNLARVILDPSFTPMEEPEQLLTVHDNEITVEKYLSPAQLAELEAKKLAEEERRRREKLDNWRERGLEEMMGGVLEVRKEDELKKDVPKPAFLLTGKPLGHWTEDDKRLYAEYERKVKELNEEREKYRKFLEAEVKKLYGQIDEEKAKFDEHLTDLFNHWIRIQMAVLQEELKVWRIKWMLLIEEELLVREYQLLRMKEQVERETKEMKSMLNASKEVLEQAQEIYEIQCAEDRILEKNFRKDFSDVHGPLYDYIAKAFRRRPKRMVMTSPVHNTETEKTDQTLTQDKPGSTLYNPYVDKSSHKRLPKSNTQMIEECLRDLDNDPAREGQPGMDNVVWERLCKYRRRKVEKELEVKASALHLADINAFVQKREEELRNLTLKQETINSDLTELLKDFHRNQTDLELQLLTKQGLVELEVADNAMVHDFSDALLIHRDRVEDLNKHILMLGESKVSHMIRNKEFKKRFYHLEWELRQMLMHYEDLQAKQADIRKFKITREVQKYLESSDYDGLINTQILTIEQTINLQRKTHEKCMEQKRKRLQRYQVQKGEKLDEENRNAVRQLQELNVSLHEAKHIHEQSRCVDNQANNRTSRHKLIVQQQRLMQLANEQERELRVLREEAARMRGENFTSNARLF